MTTSLSSAPPWREVEIELTAEASQVAPYAAVEVWADFTCGEEVLRRPAFWDGGDRWRLRFAAPHAGDWDWVSGANVDDPGLDGRAGTVVCVEGGGEPGGPAFEHGFWRMSPSGRQLVHADGTPALMVADTAWALPWRATPEQVQDVRPRPPGQGVQRRPADDGPAGHARRGPARPHAWTRASTWRSRTCRTAACGT